ncbi:unnamed protein product, partial [Strongylus vulgaris]
MLRVKAVLVDAIPLLFCLCDEPILATDLAKRKLPKSPRVLDRRFSSSPSAKINEQEQEPEIPNKEWVSSTRCLEVLRENYKPGRLNDIINNVDEVVISKAVVSALYTAVHSGITIDQAVVRSILDEQCECTSLEIDGVAKNLNKFCAHLNKEAKLEEDPNTTFCGEDKVQLTFAKILHGTFNQVPGLPYYYYTPQRKESDGRYPITSEMASFNGLFGEHAPRGWDATFIERKNSTTQPEQSGEDRSPDEAFSAAGSLRRSDRPLDQFRLRYALNGENEIEKMKNAEDKHVKNVHGSDFPLFIYFMCSVEYPDRSMDTFPLTFLPTCVHEVAFPGVEVRITDVASVVVRLDIYVMTWPSEEENRHDDSDSESDEDTHSERQIKFMAKLPKKVRAVVSELMNRLNRLVELETVLLDSRKPNITVEKIKEISKYIEGECAREKEYKSGQFETRLRRFPLVIQCEEAMDRLKDRMNGLYLEYCVLRRVADSNMYYCCQVEDLEAYERYTRHKSGSRSDSCDANELLRRDHLYDFWVILTIDDNIKLQFCQRENGRHDRIFELAWRKCRQTIRVINQELLLNRMFELRECDPLLMTNMNDSISAHDSSLDRSNTSSVSEDHEVDTHIAHGARFTFAPGYFACKLQEQLWFEVHPRLRVLRSNSRDPLAFGCEALRITLEQFAIRNIPNTYVVRESNGNVSYMQLHTSVETFGASLKMNKITVKKKKVAEEAEKFKNHILLAVYGVDKPGHEICEVLSECLQKRLNQVTLNQLIDTLAKNTQTRLDCSDVQFLQRDPASPAGVFNYSIPNSMAQFLQPLSYYTHQHMQAAMPSARYKEDYGSGSTHGDRSVFFPLPFPEKQPESYVPIFYLLVKSPQGGIRSTGIAAIELRFVNSNGSMATLTLGRLNNSTHQSLAPTNIDDEKREAFYREMTMTMSCKQPREMP